MAGKAKPELGIVLLAPPTKTKNTITAEIVLSSKAVANVAFETKWNLAEGGYYDVEANDRDGDASFLQLKPSPNGASLESLPASFFTSTILGVEGRFGSYGAPLSPKVLLDKSGKGVRQLDYSFSALSPQSEFPRRITVAALQPQSGGDILMFVSGASEKRWTKSAVADEAYQQAQSFRVVSTRPTALSRVSSSDYRFGKGSGPSTMKSRNDGPIYVDEDEE